METLKFEDYEKLACYVSDKFDEIKENDGDVTVIAKYNDAKEILKELLCLGHNVISFDIHMPEWEGYKDPYSIAICNDGIWCTKAKNEDNEYYDELADVVYIFSDCSSSILKKIETKLVYEVSVGDDEDSCDNCELYVKSDSDVKITINGKPIELSDDAKERLFDALDEATTWDSLYSLFGARHRQILNAIEEMDEMNEWLKLLSK